MLIDHSQEKLKNAIAYFVKNTQFCGKTKLYKLLYFLDFEHYQSVGRSVTGLDYFAWPKGPVPVEIHQQIQDAESSLHDAFFVSIRMSANGYNITEIKPKFEFNSSNFSKRELKIMNALALRYKSAYADKMVEDTHLENKPWDKVYNIENNAQNIIPYKLAVRVSETEEMEKLIVDNLEFKDNYK